MTTKASIHEALAESLLENWGRWCYENPHKLGFTLPPTSRGYIAKLGEKRLPSKPINEQDALVSEAAITRIGLKEWPRDDLPAEGLPNLQGRFFSVYVFIRDKWARRLPYDEIAEKDGCSKRTVFRRQKRAMDEFLAEYYELVRARKKLSENACNVSLKML